MKKNNRNKHFNNVESEFQTIDPFKKRGHTKKTFVNGPRYTIEFVDSIVTVSGKDIDGLSKKYPKAKFLKWDNHYGANNEIYIKMREKLNGKINEQQLNQNAFNRLKEIQEFRGHDTFIYALDSQKGSYTALGLSFEQSGEFTKQELVKLNIKRFPKNGGHYAVGAAVLKAKEMGLNKFVIFTDSVEAMNDIYVPSRSSEFSRNYREWFNNETEGMDVEVCKIKGRKTIIGNFLAAETVSDHSNKEATTTYDAFKMF